MQYLNIRHKINYEKNSKDILLFVKLMYWLGIYESREVCGGGLNSKLNLLSNFGKVNVIEKAITNPKTMVQLYEKT